MAREPKNELAETTFLLNFFSFYFLGGRRGQLKKEKLKDVNARQVHQISAL